MKAVEALALVGGHVDEELLLRNEYLAAENEILRSKIPGRVPMTDDERIRLAKIGKRLGTKALKDVAAIVTFAARNPWGDCPTHPDSFRILGDDPDLVQAARGQEIRRLDEAWTWSSSDRPGGREAHRPLRRGERLLGLRPNRRRPGGPRPRGLRRDGRPGPASSRHPTRWRAEAEDAVGRLHRRSRGHDRRC